VIDANRRARKNALTRSKAQVMMQSRFKWMFRPGALVLAMVTGTAALLNAAASHAQQAAITDCP